jgi:DNA-binding MarR family transcriptional regulator
MPTRSTGTDALAVMDALRRIVRALRVFTHASERELGVSAAQLFVLRQLATAPGQSLGDLANGARTSPSSVSEVATALVRHGLVRRGASAIDRRRAEFTITPKGRDVLTRAPVTVQERLVAGFERLPPATRRALRDGFEAWIDEAGLAGVPPAMFFERAGPSARPRRQRA